MGKWRVRLSTCADSGQSYRVRWVSDCEQTEEGASMGGGILVREMGGG